MRITLIERKLNCTLSLFSDFSGSSYSEGRKNLKPFGCLLLGGTQFFLGGEGVPASSSEDRVIISIPFRSYCNFNMRLLDLYID